MNSSTPRYAVITPAKNESAFIGQTIASMIAQSCRPVVWVIVDDASTDATARIVKEAAANNAWIRYLLHPGQLKRKTGSAEVHAFDFGLASIKDKIFDFVVKLDSDLRFEADYFARLLAEFDKNSKLGITSGIYLEESDQSWEPVLMPSYHAAGASKVVRRACFEQIGGFLAQRGWDTIDEIRAMARGWETSHFPDITFFHLRKEGTGMGQIHTNVMHGEIYYRTGGGLLFFLVKVLNRTLRGSPFFICGAAMFYGYLSAILRRMPRLVSSHEAATYRRMLNSRLFGGLRRIIPS